MPWIYLYADAAYSKLKFKKTRIRCTGQNWWTVTVGKQPTFFTRGIQFSTDFVLIKYPGKASPPWGTITHSRYKKSTSVGCKLNIDRVITRNRLLIEKKSHFSVRLHNAINFFWWILCLKVISHTQKVFVGIVFINV